MGEDKAIIIHISKIEMVVEEIEISVEEATTEGVETIMM